MKKGVKLLLFIAGFCAALAVIVFLLGPPDLRDSVDMVPFDSMEYERVSAESVEAMMDDVVSAAGEGDQERALEELYELTDEYFKMTSMVAIADIRYSIDVTDEYYAGEYEYMSQAYSETVQALEKMYGDLASTPAAEYLEREYFGDGFFDAYDGYDYDAAPEITQLLLRENELVNMYRQEAADRSFVYGGQEMTYDQLLTSDMPDNEFDEAEITFLRGYNDRLGNIYTELVKTRKQLAEALGYDSYMDYAYDSIHLRTYTVQDASEYIDDIFTDIAPYYVPAYMDYAASAEYYEADSDDMMRYLSTAAENIGGKIDEAFDYMLEYGLYDIDLSDVKNNMSYTTYISMYYAPFSFIDPQGVSSDLLLFAHEFGHFADGYINYGMASDTDLSEVYSQGLEYLSLLYSESGDIYFSESLTREKMMDSMSTFIDQAAMAKFEELVYALPYEDITLDNINNIYRDTCKMSYAYNEYYDEYYRLSWVTVNHFFEAPAYFISYVVSNDAALALYQMELEESGSGVKAYQELISRPAEDDTFLSALERAGIPSPFEEGRTEDVGEMFKEYFSVPEGYNAAA